MAGHIAQGGELQRWQRARGQESIWGCSLPKLVSGVWPLSPLQDVGVELAAVGGFGVKLQCSNVVLCSLLLPLPPPRKWSASPSLSWKQNLSRVESAWKPPLKLWTAAKYHWWQGSHSSFTVGSSSYLFVCWGLAWSFYSCIGPSCFAVAIKFKEMLFCPIPYGDS